jgi:RNA polymerase sigma factor (sigma-70 family)
MSSGEPSFWLNPPFKDGRPIDENLILADKEFWPEAISASKNVLNDGTRAGEILEKSVYEVWAQSLENRILNPLKIPGYLRVVFYRMLYHISSRESCLLFYSPDTLHFDQESKAKAPMGTGESDSTERRAEHEKQWVRRTHKAAAVWSAPNQQSRPGANYIETVIDLEKLLNELTEEENLILRLFWLEEDDWRHIAARMGMTEGNARVIGFRALRKLRRLVDSEKQERPQCPSKIVSFPKKKETSPKGSGRS